MARAGILSPVCTVHAEQIDRDRRATYSRT
jgi:hypothetical protein